MKLNLKIIPRKVGSIFIHSANDIYGTYSTVSLHCSTLQLGSRNAHCCAAQPTQPNLPFRPQSCSRPSVDHALNTDECRGGRVVLDRARGWQGVLLCKVPLHEQEGPYPTKRMSLYHECACMFIRHAFLGRRAHHMNRLLHSKVWAASRSYRYQHQWPLNADK